MMSKIMPSETLLNRISLALAEHIVFPPCTGQWASVIGPGPCPPWPGLIWQPPSIEHALDVQMGWAIEQDNLGYEVLWEEIVKTCYQRARPGGYLVVAVARPWPWGIKALKWGQSGLLWKKSIIKGGWHIEETFTIGGTPKWCKALGLGAMRVWVCTKQCAPPLNLLPSALESIVSGGFQAKPSHFQG